MKIGLDSIGFYTSRYYLDIEELARARCVDAAKYKVGLGQNRMSVAPPSEDPVTLGANAALQALEGTPREDIAALLFATETSVDQSKAGGIYIHRLLDLPSRCRVVELKQACYGSTAAVQFAVALVAREPSSKVLVVASDISRYGLGSPGEPTQGCGAVAMVVSAKPRLLAIEPEHGVHTEEVMDFWRPNYRQEAVVDGKYSARLYTQVLLETFEQYKRESGRGLGDIQHFCYHLPFSRMAEKAHAALHKAQLGAAPGSKTLQVQIGDTLHYNRQTGNSYSAAIYAGLASLLDRSEQPLEGRRVGFYSYGSGCVGEFFSGVVQPGYRRDLGSAARLEMLSSRNALSIEGYEAMFNYAIPTDGSFLEIPIHDVGRFRLAAIRDHKRIYEAVN